MTKSKQAKIVAAVGASLAAFTFGAAHAANANPFAAAPLSQGYMVAAMSQSDTKAQEAGCGANKAKAKKAAMKHATKKAHPMKTAHKMPAKKSAEGSCAGSKQ